MFTFSFQMVSNMYYINALPFYHSNSHVQISIISYYHQCYRILLFKTFPYHYSSMPIYSCKYACNIMNCDNMGACTFHLHSWTKLKDSTKLCQNVCLPAQLRPWFCLEKFLILTLLTSYGYMLRVNLQGRGFQMLVNSGRQ